MPDRREFLRATAVGAAGLLVGCGGDDTPLGADAAQGPDADQAHPDASGDPADARPDAAPLVTPPEETPESASFPLAVSSGDVTSESAILWTRYDGAASIRVVVWEMAGETYAARVFEADAVPADGGYVHVDAIGLLPGRRYRYAFFEMDGQIRVGRSPVGRFRAAIAADSLERVMFGAFSCTSNGRQFGTIAHAGTRNDLAAFLYVGDTIYADNAPAASTLAEYRVKWQENFSTAAYRGLLSSTSMLATWDDHEVDNNWDGETVDPGRLAAAAQAAFENLPLRRHPEQPDRLWKSVRWGRTAEVFVLDCRTERKPSTRLGENAEYISPEQMAWLKDALASSPAVFKVIVNSVPIGNFPPLFDAAAADRWEGYPAQRTEILSFIDETPITGVLWLSGDFHLGCIGRVDTAGPGAGQLEVVASPAAQTANPLSPNLTAPQWDWAISQDSYTILDFQPGLGRVTITFLGDAGQTLTYRSYVIAPPAS